MTQSRSPKSSRSIADVWQRLLRYIRTDLGVAFLAAAILISLAVGLGFESNKLIPTNPTASAHYQTELGNPLRFLSNWDGPIYLDLAEHGYTSSLQTNFFPLYPLLVRIVMVVLRSPLLSALVVSWTALVGAIYFYLKYLRQLYPRLKLSERTGGLLLWALFPTGIFLLATYTESLFACLALGAIAYALRKQWLLSSLFALLASAAHLNGLFVAAFAALLLWEAKVRLGNIIAGLGVASLGLIGYLIFLSVRFHDPLIFLMAHGHHATVHFNPLTILTNLLARNGVFVILLVLATVYWWRKRFSFSVYTLLYLSLIILGGPGLSGWGRYTLAVFPVQLMIFDYFKQKPLGLMAALAVSAVGWTYFAILYVAGYTGG